MSEATHSTGITLIEQVYAAFDANDSESLDRLLAGMQAAELAHVLESLPPEPREWVWTRIEETLRGEVLAELHEEARLAIVKEMPVRELVEVAETMEAEDLAEVLETLPDEIEEAVVRRLEASNRQRLEAVLAYEEGSVGRVMRSDVMSVHDDVTIAVVLRWLRRHERLPPNTDALMVVDAHGLFLGRLDIEQVLTAQPGQLVADLMRRDVERVAATDRQHDLLGLFERKDLISVAVVDEGGRLVGRVVVDDVLDLLREESERALLQQAGLDEAEDLFSPVLPSALRRGVWLGINLATVFLASWVIGQFQGTLEKIVALAVLMPVVASMGGIAGSQTLTLVIRGMALDQIARSNIRWLVFKEVGVGLLNGLAWAVVVAIVAYFWFGSSGLALVIALAMVINLLAASLSGVSIPLILRSLGVDPALSGAVVLTTVTDIMGFLSFLGLATLLLL